MPYNLLLLPLLGGFLFLHISHYYRFGAQRLDGYRLLFQSAIAGILLSVLARLAIICLIQTAPGQYLDQSWMLFSPFNYSGTSAAALLLGPVIALLTNLFINKQKAWELEIRDHGNFFLRLLHQAQKDKQVISVTLDSRKWYVGWVAQAPNLDPQEQYFRLLPLISGYRDKDTLVIRRKVIYEDVLQDPTIESDQFVVTLPLKDVKIASLFNEDVYNTYFADTDEEATG
jgi:hypothetical protein